MLTNLLPSVRHLRTPLASGYVWLICLWFALHDHVAQSIKTAHGVTLGAYKLAHLAGTAPTLAAVTFVAYLVGSALMLPVARGAGGRLIQVPRPISEDRIKIYSDYELHSPAREFLLYISGIRKQTMWRFNDLMEYAGFKLNPVIQEAKLLGERVPRNRRDHAHGKYHEPMHDISKILRVKSTHENENDNAGEPPFTGDQLCLIAFVSVVAHTLTDTAVRLRIKEWKSWDAHDKYMAEASFRYNLSAPIAVLGVVLAWSDRNPAWILFIPLGIYFFIQGVRYNGRALREMIQAMRLDSASPPVLDELRQYLDDLKRKWWREGDRPDVL